MALRVAIDATPLLGDVTGIGMFVRGLGESLAHGDDVDVMAYALSLRGHGFLGDLVPPGISVVTRAMMAGLLLRMWPQTGRPFIELWTGPIDVVHGTNFVVPPAKHAGMLVTVHDLTAVRYPQMCSRSTLRYPHLVRTAVARGAHVHVMSDYVAAEASALLHINPERIHVVPPGPPHLSTDTPAGAGNALARAERYVLTVGTIEPRKDHVTLLRAFEKLAADDPDLVLVIAGSSGWGAEMFERELRASSVGDRVRMTGRVTDRERASLIRDAAVLAYPSLYEGFGLPPLEAMQFAVPVVATTAGAVPEVVGNAAMLVPVGDPSALAEALHAVLNEDLTRTRLIKAGRVQVGKFDWNQTATQMAALYESLVEK